MKRRRWPYVLAALVVLGTPAYWWFFVESGEPQGAFALDLAELRRLANALPGDKPKALRVEEVALIEFPKVAVVAGSGWGSAQLPVFAYQAEYDGPPVLIDTAMDAQAASSASRFDAQAFGRVSAAMERASLIVITHEHFDHFGGLLTHPRRDALHARITDEQLANRRGFEPLVLPEGAFPHRQSFTYEKALAVAPGIVLWRAPGHTPGSQLVFVQLQDGRELLLLGDVAWHWENVERVRERARLVTQFFLGEDRGAVLAQLAAVKALHEAAPSVNIVPGHDATVMKRLLDSGALVAGFQ